MERGLRRFGTAEREKKEGEGGVRQVYLRAEKTKRGGKGRCRKGNGFNLPTFSGDTSGKRDPKRMYGKKK